MPGRGDTGVGEVEVGIERINGDEKIKLKIKILLLIRGFNFMSFKTLESSHLVTTEVGCKPIRAHSQSNQPTRFKGCGRGL